MNYMHHQIARTEHEQRNASLKQVNEDEFQSRNQADAQGRVSIKRLRPILTSLVNLLAK